MDRDGETQELPPHWGCPHCMAAPEDSPAPGLRIRALNMMEELSFLQPSQLGCWLGFLKQSLASSLAAPELVCLVWRTALIPIASYLDGRSLEGGSSTHSSWALMEAKAFPLTHPTGTQDLPSGRASLDVLLAQQSVPSGALFSPDIR